MPYTDGTVRILRTKSDQCHLKSLAKSNADPRKTKFVCFPIIIHFILGQAVKLKSLSSGAKNCRVSIYYLTGTIKISKYFCPQADIYRTLTSRSYRQKSSYCQIKPFDVRPLNF